MNASLIAFVGSRARGAMRLTAYLTWTQFNSMPNLPDYPVVSDSPFPLAYDGMVDAMMRYTKKDRRSQRSFCFALWRVETSFGGSYPLLNKRQNMSLHRLPERFHVNKPVDPSHHDACIGALPVALLPPAHLTRAFEALQLYGASPQFLPQQRSWSTPVQGLMAQYSGVNIHKHPPVGNRPHRP